MCQYYNPSSDSALCYSKSLEVFPCRSFGDHWPFEVNVEKMFNVVCVRVYFYWRIEEFSVFYYFDVVAGIIYP